MQDSLDAAAVDKVALERFRKTVLTRGKDLYRDLPWRRTTDPYSIWISEVMLQQTQVTRVDGRWQRWLLRFPTVDALAAADTADVLDEWQGMGYNRRALSLLRAAQAVSAMGGQMPSQASQLVSLPGIGPATAAGIRAFAFNLPGVYLETNVRTVVLHELYPDAVAVPDRELIPIVEATCPPDASDPNDDPRTWYYALLDYGAYLKKTVPNPSRRSRTHVRQTRFDGSHRQKRAMVVRAMLAHRADACGGATLAAVVDDVSQEEAHAGRPPVDQGTVLEILEELAREGFCHAAGDLWCV